MRTLYRVDSPRLLHRHSEHGYTEQPALALPREPEAVSQQQQERQATEAWHRDRDRIRASWAPYRQQLLGLLEHAAGFPWSAGFRDELQTVARAVERVDKRL